MRFAARDTFVIVAGVRKKKKHTQASRDSNTTPVLDSNHSSCLNRFREVSEKLFQKRMGRNEWGELFNISLWQGAKYSCKHKPTLTHELCIRTSEIGKEAKHVRSKNTFLGQEEKEEGRNEGKQIFHSKSKTRNFLVFGVLLLFRVVSDESYGNVGRWFAARFKYIFIKSGSCHNRMFSKSRKLIKLLINNRKDFHLYEETLSTRKA